jgi:hypothetical protein
MMFNVVAFPHLTMLSREQCETVHRASLEDAPACGSITMRRWTCCARPTP